MKFFRDVWLFLVLMPMLLHAEFHICTVASHPSPDLDQLLESAARQGIEIEILGYGQEYYGNATKLNYMSEYLRALPVDDVVLFIDAYDVIIMATKETIFQKFLAMKAPFVVSVERNCYPEPSMAFVYPPSPTSFRYLNSGSYIGYVYAIQNILKELDFMNNKYECDQNLMIRHFLQHPEYYKFDYFCELFIPLILVEEEDLSIDVKNGTVLCKETNTMPCIIHGNGAGKPLYQHIFNLIFRGHD